MLFVTRKYPPRVGGMETLAAEVAEALRGTGELHGLLALGRAQHHLVWWLPLTSLRLAWRVLARPRITDVLVGDALAFAALQPVLRPARVRLSVMVHGLDLTFAAPGYRAVAGWALRRADRVLANSASTGRIAQRMGVPANAVVVVNPAVPVPDLDHRQRQRARRELRRLLGLDQATRVVVTLGRLVRRKGVAWFVEHVLPGLPEDVHYAVAGTGPEREPVARAAAAAGTAHRVHLLGRVSDPQRETVLAGGDVFVQPNIPVPDDVEGFGLVTVEAAVRGTPVVAARLEGITDAVIDGETGLLCDPEDAGDFLVTILTLLEDEQRRQELAAAFRRASRRRFAADGFPARLTAALPGG